MLAAALVSAVIAAVAASIRLLPWLVSAGVSWRVAWSFAYGLAFASLEVVLLVAPALGASHEVARAMADGSVSALFALGISPRRYALHAGFVAAAAGALSLVVSFAWGMEARRPGRFSNEMLAGGRSVCAEGRPVDVPMMGVSWVCVDGEPRIVGRVGDARRTQLAWTASSATFAEDLSSVSIRDVHAVMREPPVDIQVAHVTVAGLVPWLVASPIGAGLRGLASVLAVLSSTVASVWVLLRLRCASRPIAVAVGVVGPVAFLLAGPEILAHGALVGAVGTVVVSGAVSAGFGFMLAGIRLSKRRRSGTNREGVG